MQKWEHALLSHRIEIKGGFIKANQKEFLELHFYDPSKKNVNYNPKQKDEIIKWLGSQGWELVSATDRINERIENEATIYNWYYFKRQVDE